MEYYLNLQTLDAPPQTPIVVKRVAFLPLAASITSRSRHYNTQQKSNPNPTPFPKTYPPQPHLTTRPSPITSILPLPFLIPRTGILALPTPPPHHQHPLSHIIQQSHNRPSTISGFPRINSTTVLIRCCLRRCCSKKIWSSRLRRRMWAWTAAWMRWSWSRLWSRDWWTGILATVL